MNPSKKKEMFFYRRNVVLLPNIRKSEDSIVPTFLCDYISQNLKLRILSGMDHRNVFITIIIHFYFDIFVANMLLCENSFVHVLQYIVGVGYPASCLSQLREHSAAIYPIAYCLALFLIWDFDMLIEIFRAVQSLWEFYYFTKFFTLIFLCDLNGKEQN